MSLSTSTPMLTSPTLPKLKQNRYHMVSVCMSLQCSSSVPGVTAVILTFAGDLVNSEGRIRTAGETGNRHTEDDGGMIVAQRGLPDD